MSVSNSFLALRSKKTMQYDLRFIAFNNNFHTMAMQMQHIIIVAMQSYWVV